MIQSFLIPNATDGRQHLIFDTVIDGKPLCTACGVGQVKNNQPLLGEVGKATLVCLTEYAKQANGAAFTIRFQEIANPAKAKARVKRALESANQKDAVFFVCQNANLYNLAVAALNPHWVTPSTPQ